MSVSTRVLRAEHARAENTRFGLRAESLRAESVPRALSSALVRASCVPGSARCARACSETRQLGARAREMRARAAAAS
eukprot:14567092-Alexandrium_andersonii.AAC.1